MVRLLPSSSRGGIRLSETPLFRCSNLFEIVLFVTAVFSFFLFVSVLVCLLADFFLSLFFRVCIFLKLRALEILGGGSVRMPRGAEGCRVSGGCRVSRNIWRSSPRGRKRENGVGVGD